MDAYKMCITNISTKLRSSKPSLDGQSLTAFDYAYGVSVGFCKTYEEVVYDIINWKENTNV